MKFDYFYIEDGNKIKGRGKDTVGVYRVKGEVNGDHFQLKKKYYGNLFLFI